MSESWSAYLPGADWSVVENAPHWVVTQTASTTGNDGSAVHYDLLSGSLLVDGEPPGCLPSDYEKHASYGRPFGSSTVEVMPAKATGMLFSAKTRYFGYKIQFGMAAAPTSFGKDLLVQASKDSSEAVYELLPRRLFQNLVPTFFVQDFVHWYDWSNGDVELRPAKEPWTTSSPGEWRLVKCDDSKWRLTQPKNVTFLVAVGSPAAFAIARILSPLVKPPFIHLIFQSNLSFLNIEIPSLRVGFVLDRGYSSLRSREFPHICVAEDQSLGTLVGFGN